MEDPTTERPSPTDGATLDERSQWHRPQLRRMAAVKAEGHANPGVDGQFHLS